MLEQRIDNVVYRIGFARVAAARQLVSHGHFAVNGVPTNIPSYQLKPGTVRGPGVAPRARARSRREGDLASTRRRIG